MERNMHGSTKAKTRPTTWVNSTASELELISKRYLDALQRINACQQLQRELQAYENRNAS